MIIMYSNIDDKNEMYTTINGIVTRVGLRPESINNGYEKWAEGISKLTMVMRNYETSMQPTVLLLGVA